MDNDSYVEKLKDPRWQRKRLEILQRDGWACKECGETEKTLHIHHLFYFKGKDPWEIPSGFLITLCQDCHESIKENIKEFDITVEYLSTLVETFFRAGFDSGDLLTLASAFNDVAHSNAGRLNGTICLDFKIRGIYQEKRKGRTNLAVPNDLGRSR